MRVLIAIINHSLETEMRVTSATGKKNQRKVTRYKLPEITNFTAEERKGTLSSCETKNFTYLEFQFKIKTQNKITVKIQTLF